MYDFGFSENQDTKDKSGILVDTNQKQTTMKYLLKYYYYFILLRAKNAYKKRLLFTCKTSQCTKEKMYTNANCKQYLYRIFFQCNKKKIIKN